MTLAQSPFGPPCPPTQLTSVPLTFLLVTSVALALLLVFAFIFHAVARERAISREEFREANERIIARITFLTLRHGEDLRWLCMAIARDLIRVMHYVQKEVSEHSPNPNLLQFLRETERIHRNARMIKVALYVKPLTAFAYERTTRTTERFLSRWTALLNEYRMKYPESGDRFPA